MFSKSLVQNLFAYHWHNTERLMACASCLDESDYRDDTGYGHGSIHDLLFHVLDTDESWRKALETGQQPPSVAKEDFPDLASLQLGFGQARAAWQAHLDSLTPEAIESDVVLTAANGATRAFPRWRIMQHLVLHGMQHHAEIAMLLTSKGETPEDIDFIFFT